MKTIRSVVAAALVVGGCASAAAVVQNGALPRSTPEAEGVSTQGVVSFLDAVAESGLEVHSFMLLRNGNVVAEGWWEPYGPEFRHVMFSASKTVTALGVGIAVDEGKLNLDDPVVSFFPEYMSDSISDATRALTVRHLLTMSVGQTEDPAFAGMRSGEDWVRGFLHASPVHEPGIVFMYNNAATFMLSAIVQQATGERLFHYLQPRLFEPLGIENVTWDLNPQGITVGMIGARFRTEDLAKFGQLMLQKGSWNGEQLVSAEYVEDAAAIHIDTNNANAPADEVNDGQRGYGYQVWHGSHGSFRIDGLGGQLAIVLPEHDAVAVFTAGLPSAQPLMDLVWAHLVPALHDGPLPADPDANARLADRLASLRIAPATHAGGTSLPNAAAVGQRFMLADNPQGIAAVTLSVQDGGCVLALEREDEVRTLEAGLGTWRYAEVVAASLAGGVPPGGFRRDSNGTAPDTANVAALSCGVKEDDTVEIIARFVEDNIGSETWTIGFEDGGERVTITPRASRAFGPPPAVLSGTSAAAAQTAGDRSE